jgi:hypothetical protein
METERNSRKPGSNIDSWCGKCKLVLAHTIEAMVGDKPARVHCNTCKSQHAYRPGPPGKTTRQKGEAGERTPRQPGKPRTSKYQSLLNSKSASVPRTYSPKEKYQEGDVLEHPMFGRGVATAIKEGSKIEVLFESGSKTLIHER